jgi:hypothetical protein
MRSRKFVSLALPVLALAAGMAAIPAAVSAQGPARQFIAELAAPSAEARLVAGGLIWRCAESRCTAALNGTRPLRVCRELQREAGQVLRFEAGGTPLAEEDLARCNG